MAKKLKKISNSIFSNKEATGGGGSSWTFWEVYKYFFFLQNKLFFCELTSSCFFSLSCCWEMKDGVLQQKGKCERLTEAKGKKTLLPVVGKNNPKASFWKLPFFLEKASKSLFSSPMVVKASTVLGQKTKNFFCLFLTRHVLEEKRLLSKNKENCVENWSLSLNNRLEQDSICCYFSFLSVRKGLFFFESQQFKFQTKSNSFFFVLYLLGQSEAKTKWGCPGRTISYSKTCKRQKKKQKEVARQSYFGISKELFCVFSTWLSLQLKLYGERKKVRSSFFFCLI